MVSKKLETTFGMKDDIVGSEGKQGKVDGHWASKGELEGLLGRVEVAKSHKDEGISYGLERRVRQ